MFFKKVLPVIFFLHANLSSAQKIIFSNNFEGKQLDSAWQIITGNWGMGDMKQLRIVFQQSDKDKANFCSIVL